jgi:hypothetical protein
MKLSADFHHRNLCTYVRGLRTHGNQNHRKDTMNRRSVLSIAVITILAIALLPGVAMSRQKSIKSQIVGTWTLVSWEQTRADGTKNYRFGTNPKGINTFDATGHFSLIIMRPDLPKLASSDPEKATPEEAQSIAHGSIAYFGTYTINPADKMLSLKIDGTTLVNQLGIEQKRKITSISADEMKYSNPTAIGGGQIALVWKRVK